MATNNKSNFRPDGNLDVQGNLTVRGNILGYGTTTFLNDTVTVNDADGYVINSDSDVCLLYTSPSPRDRQKSRMPSSA